MINYSSGIVAVLSAGCGEAKDSHPLLFAVHEWRRISSNMQPVSFRIGAIVCDHSDIADRKASTGNGIESK